MSSSTLDMIKARHLGSISRFPKKVRYQIYNNAFTTDEELDIPKIKKDANVTGPIVVAIHLGPNQSLLNVSSGFAIEVDSVLRPSLYVQFVRLTDYPKWCYCKYAFYTAHATVEGLNKIDWSQFHKIEFTYARMKAFIYAKDILGLDPTSKVAKPYISMAVLPSDPNRDLPVIELFYDGHLLTVNYLPRHVAQPLIHKLAKLPPPTFCARGPGCAPCTIQYFLPRKVQGSIRGCLRHFSPFRAVTPLRKDELEFLPRWQGGKCGSPFW